MNIVHAAIYFLLALMLVLAGATRIGAWLIERRHTPVGAFALANGTRIHFVHVPGPTKADLPPIVFIHGACQSERPDGAAQALAREPRRTLVF